MIDWQPTLATPELHPSDIHVWRLPDCVPDRAMAWLDAAEQARLAAMVDAMGRHRLLATRAGLRQVLAGYLGCTPAEVPLTVAEGGKPRIAGGPQFNLSHGGDLALLAVASQAVGIDVEPLRTVPRALAIARRSLGSDISESLAKLPAGERDQAFLSAWTAMEARQKCRGQGVFGHRVDLDEIGSLAFTPDHQHLAHLAWANPQHEPDIHWLLPAS